MRGNRRELRRFFAAGCVRRRRAVAALWRAAQRRANLESLRALARKYEHAWVTNHLPATVAGFLFWCDDLSASGGDLNGSDDQLDAIHVSTCHKAKGLEWPAWFK